MSKLFDTDEPISDVIESNNNLILNQVTYDIFKLILKEKCNTINFSQSSIEEIIKDAIHCREILIKYNIVKGDKDNDN